MTAEQVKVEIQLEIKKAIADLKISQEELKRVAEEAKRAMPPAAQLATAMNSMSKEMKLAASEARLFGDKLGGLESQQNILRSSIRQLISAGWDPEGNAIRKLKADYDALGKELSSITAKERALEAEQARKVATMSSLKGAMSSMIGPLVAVAGAGQVFQNSMNVEDLRTQFGVMLGDMDKGAAMFAKIKKYADITPYDTGTLAKASSTWLQFGGSVEKVMPMLSMMGDVAMGNKEKMGQLALVMGQVSSAGKLQGQDLLQLINAGFNPLQEISRTTGESMASLRAKMEAGAISYSMVENAMKTATSAGGLFYQGMEKGAGNMSTKLSTMVDALLTAGSAMLSTVWPAIKLGVDLLTGFSNGISQVVG